MTVATITDWLDRLQGVRKSGTGYNARCPAHDDANPSLSITEGDDGKVLVHCFAGCTFEAIRDALWPQGPRSAATGGGRSPSAPRNKPARAPKVAPEPRELPAGPHVTVSPYRHADGSVAFASVRQEPPGKAKQFSQWTPTKDGLWLYHNPLKVLPLYRLPQIMGAEKVVVVEGEKCVQAVLEAWPDVAVTTYAGGSSAWRKSDWAPLAGKEVSIWADADDDAPPDKPKAKSRPGQAAAIEIAAHLHGLGCRVRVAVPEPDGGADIADWLAVGKTHARATLDGLLRDYVPGEPQPGEPQPESQPQLEPEPESEPGYLDVIASNDHYRILGLVGDAVAIRISAGRVLQRTRESLTQPSTLIAIAPLAWWAGVLGGDGETLSTAQSRRLGDSMLRAADRLGQWDQSQYGRGAVRLPGGKIVYHLGDRLLVDGEERPLDDGEIAWMAEPRIALAPSATDQECLAIADAVMSYRWGAPMDGKRMLGWMVSAIVGGALEWRPHIQITAPSGQGKSWLLREVLAALMGPLLQRIADASSAALARMTAHASLPFSFDEAEPSAQWVLDLLSLMRISAGGEGQRIRVDMQTGGVQVQAPRFSALLSNVSAPDMSRADASRVVNVSLGQEVEDWPAVEAAILGAMAHAPGVRARIIREAPAIVDHAKAIAREMQGSGMDSREALASGALTAGWHWWNVDYLDVHSSDDHDRDRTDATDCLKSIMSLSIRDASGAGKTLAKALTSDAAIVADLFGVRYDGADGLQVMYGHPGLKVALRGTPWEKAELKSALKQLEGAETTNALRIGIQRRRCVNIPHATLLKAGFELGEETDKYELD